MLLYGELAPLYFPLESSVRDFSGEVEALIGQFRSGGASVILDVGCGTGEHVRSLRDAGFDVVGADGSASMIETARSRYPDCDFRVLDMEHIALLTDSPRFHFAYSLCGSFNYLLEDASILAGLSQIRSTIRPGGRFLLDVWNARPFQIRSLSGKGSMVKAEVDGREIRRTRAYTLREEGSLVDVVDRYVIGDREKEDRHTVRVFHRKEAERFCRESGFRVREVYDSFEHLRGGTGLGEEDPFTSRIILLLETV